MIVTEQKAEILVDSENDNDGYITLMSIHKSKGLEFTIVILPHFDKDYMRETKQPTFLYSEYKETIAFGKNDKIFSFPDAYDDDPYFKDIWQDEEGLIISEEHHILYVALTRAENIVIIVYDKPYKKYKSDNYWAKWVD
jgi:ATP-dependent exoDNAse (exonuclease V) beta subunit